MMHGPLNVKKELANLLSLHDTAQDAVTHSLCL